MVRLVLKVLFRLAVSNGKKVRNLKAKRWYERRQEGGICTISNHSIFQENKEV